MNNNKVILLVELFIKPDCVNEVMEAARNSVALALELEPGVLSMTVTHDVKQINHLIFFEVYASQEAFDAHQQTTHAKHFFDVTKDKRLEPSKPTFLVEF